MDKNFFHKIWKNEEFVRLSSEDDCSTRKVEITFLRMNKMPSDLMVNLPVGYEVKQILAPNPDYYKSLYRGVGKAYCWWMRLACSDEALERILNNPDIEFYIVHHHGQNVGFFELEKCSGHDVNLSYFGLFPDYIGKGLGYAVLCQAIIRAWQYNPRYLLVNTCTADHPRAMLTYLRAGFNPYRIVSETWRIPPSLGIDIPTQEELDNRAQKNKFFLGK